MRRAYVKFYTFTAFLLILTFVYAYSSSYVSHEYERFTKSVYTKSLAALTDNIESIRTTLDEASYAEPVTELALVSEKLRGLSGQASVNLNLLPFSDENAANINSFLTGLEQTSGYIIYCALNNADVYDPKLSNLTLYKKYAETLSYELRVISDSGSFDKAVSEFYSFYDYSETFSYPTFENGIVTGSEYAEQIARELLGSSLKLTLTSNVSSKPAYYRYKCGNAYIDISQNVGAVIRLGIDHKVNEINLSESEALEKIKLFLSSYGYTNTAYDSHVISGGLLIAKFNAVQKSKFGDIICMNDEITVGTALDKGKICLFNADTYWKHNCARELPESITQPKLAADETSTLIFTSDKYGNELLCYKIKTGDGRVRYTEAVTGNNLIIYPF